VHQPATAALRNLPAQIRQPNSGAVALKLNSVFDIARLARTSRTTGELRPLDIREAGVIHRPFEFRNKMDFGAEQLVPA
jgi:hypothetical protein